LSLVKSATFFNLSDAKKVYGLSTTILSFIVSTKYFPSKLKSFIHPVLITACLTVIFQGIFGLTTNLPFADMLSSYYGGTTASFGAGDLISSMLGPAVISFGLQLYQSREMLLSNSFRVMISTIFASIFGLFSSAFLAKFLSLTPASVSLSPLTRCITTPLALAGASLTGADKSLTVLLVVLTGLLGASIGEKLLSFLNIKDSISVGLAMGASSHGIGSAALAHDPIKFTSAIVSMTLTGLWTVALLTNHSVRQGLIKIAI
jgi:putative effector of murein hydrolase